MNLLQKLQHEQVHKLGKDKGLPVFRAGDTVRVHVKVVEGERTRTQPYEGVVIGRKNRGLNSSFRVRKISYGEGVERVFPLYSPNIRVEVIRHGDVCRAKLYYLRDRTGKRARIAERSRGPLNELMATATGFAESEAEIAASAAQAAAEAAIEAAAAEATAVVETPAAAPEAAPADQAPAEEATTEDKAE